jgi:hypothetical protein
VRLSHRKPKATSAQKIDWKAFASDLDLQAWYTVKIKNKTIPGRQYHFPIWEFHYRKHWHNKIPFQSETNKEI